MDDRHTLALDAEGAPALRAHRNLQCLFAVQRGHFHLRAKRRFREADGQVIEDVGALTLEVFVRLDGERDEKVARRAATWGHLTLARHADVDAIVHTRRNVDGDAADVADAALALAALARRGDDTPLAPAAVADHDVDELAEDGLLDAANLAGALAGATPLRAGAGLSAVAPAVGAGLPARNLDLLLAAAHGLLEGDGQLVAQVRAALWAGAPGLGASGVGEDLLEDVAEAAEAEALERIGARARRARDAGMPEAIVCLALLAVAQHLIRFVDLLEALLGAFFAVDVGMVLACQPAERL